MNSKINKIHINVYGIGYYVLYMYIVCRVQLVSNCIVFEVHESVFTYLNTSTALLIENVAGRACIGVVKLTLASARSFVPVMYWRLIIYGRLIKTFHLIHKYTVSEELTTMHLSYSSVFRQTQAHSVSSYIWRLLQCSARSLHSQSHLVSSWTTNGTLRVWSIFSSPLLSSVKLSTVTWSGCTI